jgi:CopG family nickel-responsive transcriptional regulator
MTKLVRFGISLEKGLLNKFDSFLKERNYTNRSEAFRDLIRQELVKKQWRVGKEVAGAVTLVYDHHKRELVDKLTDLQHDYHHIIISTQHIHLDHDNCMEIIVVKGRPRDVEKLAHIMKATRGVKHSDLTMTTTGKELV